MPGIDVRRLTKEEIFNKIIALQRRKLDMVISLENVDDIELEIEFYREELRKRLLREFVEYL